WLALGGEDQPRIADKGLTLRELLLLAWSSEEHGAARLIPIFVGKTLLRLRGHRVHIVEGIVVLEALKDAQGRAGGEREAETVLDIELKEQGKPSIASGLRTDRPGFPEREDRIAAERCADHLARIRHRLPGDALVQSVRHRRHVVEPRCSRVSPFALTTS